MCVFAATLRALYLSDNDFENIPADIEKLSKLQIVSFRRWQMSLQGRHFVLSKLTVCLSSLFLQLSLRDNDLISLPKEIGELAHLKELHIQGNRLTVLPPELGMNARTARCSSFLAGPSQTSRVDLCPEEHESLGRADEYLCSAAAGNLDLTGPKQVFKAENNPWVTPIADQFQLGVSHVFEYVRSETYK